MTSFQQMQLNQLLLNQLLLSLGKIASLNIVLDITQINQKILSFESDFKPYNPRKKGYNRYGLSITSLDGGFSGIPDLDSLLEYNRENNTKYSESDFREWTSFFKECNELREKMTPFHKSLGRSHILRLNRGGFFPAHRDSVTPIPWCFRLFIALCPADRFVFLLDNERVFFNPGQLYFINTQLAHSLFSFEDKSDFVVFNIDLCKDSVMAVKRYLAVK